MDIGETIPSLKNNNDCNAVKHYWPSKIADEFQWFYFKILKFMHEISTKIIQMSRY